MEMTPEMSTDPAATGPVPLSVMPEAIERSAPERVSVPPPALLEIVRSSLNRVTAEITSRLGEPLNLLIETDPSVSSKIRTPLPVLVSVKPAAEEGADAPKFSSPRVMTVLRVTVCAPSRAPPRLAISPIALGEPRPPQLAESVQL